MLNVFLFLLKFYFSIFSRIFPDYAAKQALDLFQKPPRRPFKKNEIDFFKKAKHFVIYYDEENLDAYELGSNNKKLVFIVHGWGSNLGRLSKIAFRLKDEGYRVIGLNFPAHGNSKLSKTNMVFSKNAFQELINFINPVEPFSVVSHSFGSSVVTLALKENQQKVNNLIFLTSANKTSEIFYNFKKGINLSNKSFNLLLKKSNRIVNLDFMKLNIEDLLSEVKYNKLLVVHDVFDKMLPYRYAKEIIKKARNSELMTIENKGHSGMLFEDNVIEKVIDFLKD